MEPNLIILAGGASSRMKQSVESGQADPSRIHEVRTKSKAMLSVDGKGRPFLDYLLYNVQEAGYTNVIIVTAQNDTSVREYYERQAGALKFSSLHISYVVQSIPSGRTKPLGTADALLQALTALPSWKGQHFTVCNSDNLYSANALRLLREDSHANSMIDYNRAALQFSEERIARFAVIFKTEDGFLRDIIEKPSLEEVERARDRSGRVGVSMNLWHFSFDEIYPVLQHTPVHPVRQEKELPSSVKMMIAANPRAVFAIPLSEHVIDMTTEPDIPAVTEYLKEHFPHMKKEHSR